MPHHCRWEPLAWSTTQLLLADILAALGPGWLMGCDTSPSAQTLRQNDMFVEDLKEYLNKRGILNWWVAQLPVKDFQKPDHKGSKSNSSLLLSDFTFLYFPVG